MNRHKHLVSILAGILVAAMLLSLVLSLIPTGVSAASSSEIRDQLDELKAQNADLADQMAALEEQMADNLSEMQTVVDEKNRIDQQIFLLNRQIDNINNQIAAYGLLIADKQDELDEAEARYQELSDQNRARVRAMEEEGSLSYWSVLFKANSFSDLLDRLSMIEEIAAADQRRLQELNEAAQEVEDARQELETEKQSLEGTREEYRTAQDLLEVKRQESDDLLENLVSRGEEFERYMMEKEEEQAQLMLQIAQKNDEYDEAVEAEYWATYVPPTTQPTWDETPSPAAPNDGGWICPVPYYVVTSAFGMRVHPIYGTWTMHYGVDLACEQGTPIYAARSGVVSEASYQYSFGYYVTIDHDSGFRTIYMHMTEFIVSPGDYVSQGQVIGYVGSTGDSTGPHLHFGLSYNGTYVNPMDYI